jgi:hypothetical protein
MHEDAEHPWGVVSLSHRASAMWRDAFWLSRLIDLAEIYLGQRRFGRQLDRRGIRVYLRAVTELMAGDLAPAIGAYAARSPGAEGFQELPPKLVALVVAELRRIVATIDAEIG